MDSLRRFLVSCEFVDSSPMAVLMEGCKAHAEVDAFPLWASEWEADVMALKLMYPHLTTFEETWLAVFPTRESIECFTELLATVDFKAPDYVRLVEYLGTGERGRLFNLEQFHKHIFHPS